MIRVAAAIFFWLALGCNSYAQQNAQVIGPITVGHCPVFNSPTVIKDSGLSCVGGAGGIVFGPASSVVGNFAEWNNTTGTLLDDAGFTTGTSGHTIPFLDGNNTYSLTQIIPEVSAPAATNLVLNTPTGQIIALEVNGTSYVQFSSSALNPTTDNSISLGTAANRWSNIYSALATVSTINSPAATNLILNAPSGQTIVFANNGSQQGSLSITGGVSILNLGVAGIEAGEIVIASPVANAMTLVNANSATGTAAIPSGTYNFVGDSITQTLTNKTLTSTTDVLGGVTMTLGSDATGDIYYRNSGGVLTRLPVCTGTQVIGASGGIPTCVAQVGTGSMVYLCTITASNSASLNNASPTSGTCPINSTYTSYELRFLNIVPATNEKILELQIHSGGAYKATGYLTGSNFTTSTTNANQAITTYIPLSFPSDANIVALANAAPGLSGKVTITNPSANALCMIYSEAIAYLNGNGNPITGQTNGYWNTAGVVDGFQVLMDSGNITSGSILVYGIL